MNDEEFERFKKLAADRSEARDKLFSALNLLHLYYGNRVALLIAKFKAWDEAQATKEFDQLPQITEWLAHQVGLLAAIERGNTKMSRSAVILAVAAFLVYIPSITSEGSKEDFFNKCPALHVLQIDLQ